MAEVEAMVEVVRRLDAAVGLDALYLFGSRAKGTATARSDWDLAALFREAPDGIALMALAQDVAALVGADVDLVDLDRASPILAIQVLKTGRLVHEGDRSRRVAFEARTPGLYEDIQRIRKPQVDALLRGIVHGRP